MSSSSPSTSTLRQFSSLQAVDLAEAQGGAGGAGGPLHLAVGMFDGLHRGHQAVVARAVEAARASGGLAAVLTFWPHPSHLFRPEAATQMLMLPGEKARVLAQLGVEALITQPFTPEFAALEAEAVLAYFKQALPALAGVYVGENWRFGRGRRGDVALLQSQAAELGVQVVGLPRVNFAGEAISSTRIRAAISAGQIEQANAMLGYPYFAQGHVQAGRELGRTIGFPTLNIEWVPELQPRYGVYAVEISEACGTEPLASAREPGRRSTRPGIANYGLRPTVGTQAIPLLEAFVLGDCPWDRGDDLVVELRHFIRPEQKFSGLDALKAQIAADTAQAREWLTANPRP